MGSGNLKAFTINGGPCKSGCFMRHERFIPMEYVNQELMTEWNEFNIALKIWLYPVEFGDKLADLQRRYPKPTREDLDRMLHQVYAALRTDSKPMVKY
jgi:hypothetical protein